MRSVAIVTAAITWIWLGWLGIPEHGLVFWIVGGIAVTGATAGAVLDPKRHAMAHVAIAIGQLATLAVFAGMRVAGYWPFTWDALPDPRYAALIASLAAGTSIGLARGRIWARWMAIAFAAATMLGGVLNTVGCDYPRDDLGLENALGLLGGLVMLTQLMTPAVRDRFATPLWSSRHPVIRSARWAAIAGFAAAPMLVLYALCQPVAPDTVLSALVLAPIIGAGAVLVVARRAAGILVLALGGIALAVQAGVTYAHAEPQAIAAYYVAFWAPAALLGIAAGVVTIARARR